MTRWPTLVIAAIVATVLIAPSAFAKKKKKQDEEPAGPPPAAWFDHHGVQCYNPPDFAAEPNEPKRRMMRQQAMDEMLKLLRGEINEQIVVEERKIDAWETDFLGKPAAIEPFLVEGVGKCKAYAEQELALNAYVDWLAGGGKRATAGDCHNPLAYELHQNLSVQDGWQVRRHMCKDDQVLIETSETNLYTVDDSGDYETTAWINAAAVPAVDDGADPLPPLPAAGPDYPCPDCPIGAVIYRFEYEGSDRVDIAVLGTSKEFVAPDNGFISFTVNDKTYFDNKFHEANGVIDYLPLSIYPPILGVDTGE